MTRIMLDLETLGINPGSVIVAIGAVKLNSAETFDPFYLRIDPRSCTDIGLTIDPETVTWWLKQPDAARLEITKSGIPIRRALLLFTEWLGSRECEMWANGPDFDCILLDAAYRAAGMTTPWHFFNHRCYRTARKMAPKIPRPPIEFSHHALRDAQAQAHHLIRILKG